MATSRVNWLSDIIFVRRPAGSWATFIICVVEDPISDRNKFFIVPASEAAETTTLFLLEIVIYWLNLIGLADCVGFASPSWHRVSRGPYRLH